MADKVPNNDSAGKYDNDFYDSNGLPAPRAAPVATNMVSGLTPSASDPGPVMSSSASNIISANPLTSQNQMSVVNQPETTTITPSMPLNTLQNPTSGNRFTDALNSLSAQR